MPAIIALQAQTSRRYRIFQSCQPRRGRPLIIGILGTRLIFDRSGTAVNPLLDRSLSRLIARDNYPRRRRVVLSVVEVSLPLVIDKKTSDTPRSPRCSRTLVHALPPRHHHHRRRRRPRRRRSHHRHRLPRNVAVHVARGNGLACLGPHVTLGNHRVARPVRTRARRRVTLVKFQPGIYRLKRRHTATRTPGSVGQRRRERENGEKQWGERGRERVVRRFLLLPPSSCPGSGYGGGLALTAASLDAG